MTDNGVYLGIFEWDDEFSFNFDDYELANVICIIFSQYSMWEWIIKKQIKSKLRFYISKRILKFYISNIFYNFIIN